SKNVLPPNERARPKERKSNFFKFQRDTRASRVVIEEQQGEGRAKEKDEEPDPAIATALLCLFQLLVAALDLARDGDRVLPQLVRQLGLLHQV
ncbi:hypothetical protein B8W95_13140, partial [Staphylococcus pasteuri]